MIDGIKADLARAEKMRTNKKRTCTLCVGCAYALSRKSIAGLKLAGPEGSSDVGTGCIDFPVVVYLFLF